MTIKRFCYEDKLNEHWQFCCKMGQPFVMISPGTVDIYALSYDLLSTRDHFNTRFSYYHHFHVLYGFYLDQAKLPDASREIGGSDMAAFAKVWE